MRQRSTLPGLLARRRFLAGMVGGLATGCAAIRSRREPEHDSGRAPGAGEVTLDVYEGVGEDRRFYRVERRFELERDGTARAASIPAFFEPGRLAPGALDFEAFLGLVAGGVPSSVHARIESTLASARELAAAGLAAPLPADDTPVRRTLLLTWTHSRDVGTLLTALGHPQSSAGVHDVEEPVPAADVRAASANQLERHERWYRAYLESLAPDEPVNVGFFNPHFAADAYGWKPGAAQEDSMVAHRLAAHHSGSPGAPHAPLECAVNRLLHEREHELGVRKAACVTVEELRARLATEESALAMMRCPFGASVAPDAIELIERLEREGKMTPWFLCRGC